MFRTENELEEASCVVIAKLISKARYFDLSKSPLPFISRSMRNHSIDEHRKRVRRRERERDCASRKVTVCYMEEDITPLLSLYKKELLTPTEQAIFYHTFQNKSNPEDVIKTMGITKSRYNRYITSIKKKFTIHVNGKVR